MVFRDAAISMLSGGAATVTVRTVEAPLERVKILLQNQNMAPSSHRPYTGALDAFVRIPRDQGFASFWRGNFTNCVRAFPSHALRFTFMDHFQELAGAGLDRAAGEPLPLHRQMLSGGMSGAVTMAITYPLDLTRTKLAADTGVQQRYNGIVHCLRQTAEHQGWRGNYKGLLISVVEITPYTAIAMGGYEFFKGTLPQDQESASAWWYPLAKVSVGWCSGLVASMVCYPLDTVKRQLMLDGSAGFQSRYNGSVLTCMRMRYHEAGLSGFYRGCSVNAIKSAPACGLTFMINDTFRAWQGHSKSS